jgi:hypothetical protein
LLWVVSFVVLNALDLLLTLLIVGKGGLELNPIIRLTIGAGIPVAAAFKIGGSGIVAWLLYRLGRKAILRVATLLMLGVCLFNTVVLITGLLAN